MNQRDQKRQNRDNILSLLRMHAHISQVEIAALASLQPSTTSNLIRTFRELGIVDVVGKRSSGPQGGKKAELLSLRGDFGYYGGIYIKNDEITFGVVDFEGTAVERRSVAIDPQDDTGLIDLVSREISRSKSRYRRYRGAGIAVSTVVDIEGGVVRTGDFSHDVPRIGSELRARNRGTPVVVDNDANCAALWDYARHRIHDLVHLQIQTTPFTVGAGIIIGGTLYRGTRGAAGELPLPVDGDSTEDVAREIERFVRMIAGLLDTQAIFLAGELDEKTFAQVSRVAGSLDAELSCVVEAIDNPDLPMIGAAHQAIRAHIDRLLKEN